MIAVGDVSACYKCLHLFLLKCVIEDLGPTEYVWSEMDHTAEDFMGEPGFSD